MTVEWQPGEGWIPTLETEDSPNNPAHGLGWGDALLVAMVLCPLVGGLWLAR